MPIRIASADRVAALRRVDDLSRENGSKAAAERVAGELGVSPKTLRRWQRERRLDVVGLGRVQSWRTLAYLTALERSVISGQVDEGDLPIWAQMDEVVTGLAGLDRTIEAIQAALSVETYSSTEGKRARPATSGASELATQVTDGSNAHIQSMEDGYLSSEDRALLESLISLVSRQLDSSRGEIHLETLLQMEVHLEGLGTLYRSPRLSKRLVVAFLGSVLLPLVLEVVAQLAGNTIWQEHASALEEFLRRLSGI